MTKKEYITPTVKTIKMRRRCLLAGSGEPVRSTLFDDDSITQSDQIY